MHSPLQLVYFDLNWLGVSHLAVSLGNLYSLDLYLAPVCFFPRSKCDFHILFLSFTIHHSHPTWEVFFGKRNQSDHHAIQIRKDKPPEIRKKLPATHGCLIFIGFHLQNSAVTVISLYWFIGHKVDTVFLACFIEAVHLYKINCCSMSGSTQVRLKCLNSIKFFFLICCISKKEDRLQL